MKRRILAAILAPIFALGLGIGTWQAVADQGGNGAINVQKCEGQGPDWEDCAYTWTNEQIFLSWYNPSAWAHQSVGATPGAGFDVCVAYTGATSGHLIVATIGTDWNLYFSILAQPGVWTAWAGFPIGAIPGEGSSFGLRTINCDYSPLNHTVDIWLINSAGNRYEALYGDNGAWYGWYLAP